MNGRIGASEEVIRHHASEHPCPPGVPADERVCPCGSTVAICCGRCEEPVFVAVQPGSWCEHAEELAGDD